LFYSVEDYTLSVDSAMESWSSSNTDNRLSDNGEMLTKEIMDQQNYQMSNSNGNGKKLRMEFIV